MSAAVHETAGANEVRGTLPLDGVWGIRFDPANQGVAEEWFAGSADRWTTLIEVPAVWEEVRPGYDGVAWYRRSFEVPQEFRDAHERFVLRFGAVNYYAQVWLNGSLVGEHEGGYTPFALEVTEKLRAGANELVVRVLDPPKDQIESILSRDEAGIDGFVLKETPCWRELESFNFGGIWQPVRLVGLSAVHVRSCFVRPVLETSLAEVQVELESSSAAEEALSLRVSIEPQTVAGPAIGDVSCSFSLPPGAKTVSVVVPVSAPVAWTPENPFLYACSVSVSAAGRTLDRHTERFGFRDFTIDANAFVLNGRRVFIKGGFHEGLYPRSIAYPPSDELAREEIRIAKEAGFNLLRVWQVPVHPAMLDAADELGMMICEEPPIEWIKDSPHLRERCLREVRELVLRDRNRPSVVLWGILNESSHLPDFPCRGPGLRGSGYTEEQRVEYWRGTQIQQIKEELCLAARSLDPTRPIIDDSGGWVGGANVYLPYRDQAQGIEDLHIYRPAPTSRATIDHLRGLSPERGPVYVSEVGYGSIPDLDAIIDAYRSDGQAREHQGEQAPHRSPTQDLEDFKQYDRLRDSLATLLSSHRLSGQFAGLADFAEATQELQAEGNRRQLEALRCNPACAGYVLHAYSAGGVVLGAEVVDIWRRPKRPVLEMLRRLHRPILLVVDTGRSVGVAGVPVDCRVTLVNEAGRFERARLEVLLEPVDRESEPGLNLAPTACTGTATPGDGARDVRGDRGVQVLFEGQTASPGEPGQYLIRARLWQDDVLLAEAAEKYWVLRRPDLSSLAGSVGVVEPGEAGGSGEVLDGLHRVGYREIVADLPTSAARALLVLNSSGRWSEDHARAWTPSLVRWVAAGGTAVLQGPFDEGDAAGMSRALPFEVRCRPSVGSWNPCVHYARDHPIFAGLPRDRLMGSPYVSVLPVHAFVDVEGDAASGCVSMEADIFRKPQKFWSGATVLEKPYGEGRFILSQLRLDGALGEGRPVETQLLLNTARYASNLVQECGRAIWE